MRPPHGKAARRTVFFHPDCEPPRRTGGALPSAPASDRICWPRDKCRGRSRARPEGPTAGGEFRPALKTLAGEPARAF